MLRTREETLRPFRSAISFSFFCISFETVTEMRADFLDVGVMCLPVPKFSAPFGSELINDVYRVWLVYVA